MKIEVTVRVDPRVNDLRLIAVLVGSLVDLMPAEHAKQADRIRRDINARLRRMVQKAEAR